MRFGKTRMFFYVNGLALAALLVYFSPWLFSATTSARVVQPYEANVVHVEYVVANTPYGGRYMRNGIAFTERYLSIRYLTFHPRTSVINSFMGMWAEPLAWWGIFILASGMLLLTNNTVFSKGTVFQLQKKYPWISMEEYFPYAGEWYYQKREDNSRKNNKGEIPLLKSRDTG